MAGITLAQAETKLSEALTAYEKAMTALEYGTGDLKVKRASLSEIQDAIKFWQSQVQSLSRGGISVKGVIPLG